MSGSNKFLLHAMIVMFLMFYCYVDYMQPVEEAPQVIDVYNESNEFSDIEQGIFNNSHFRFVKKSDQRQLGNNKVDYEVILRVAHTDVRSSLISLWEELMDLYGDDDLVIRIYVQNGYDPERFWTWCEDGVVGSF